MPFGGGGPLHTGALIKEVGLGAALVPRYPGVTSAFGCTVADLRDDRVQTVNRLLDELDADELAARMRTLAGEVEAVVTGAGVALSGIERRFELDMLYLGQTHTVAVPLAWDEGELSRAQLRGAFETAYLAAYGRLLNNIPIRVMNVRVAVIGRRPEIDMRRFAPVGGKRAQDCLIETRAVFADGETHQAGVYDRLALAVGETIAGPALLEQADTTIFVDPGLVAEVDAFGNLVIRPRRETAS
jgi:N-methylhydantoinase A